MNGAKIFVLTVLACAAAACAGVGDHHPIEPEQAQNNTLVQNRGTGKDNWWDALPRDVWAKLERVALREDQGWFEVYRVFPGVFAIYEPGQFEEVISYLIVGNQSALLFDTGLGIGDIESLVETITHLPVSVLNSHTHYDHIGGNYQFERILATATAYTRTRSAGLPHTDVAEFVSAGWIWKQTPPEFNKDHYTIRPFAIGEIVTDGQVIDLGGRTLEVVFTPGHAPDSLCLWDRENRLLFTGDTFYPAPLYTHLPGSDFSRYRVAAHRLGELEPHVDHLLPAHNVPLAAAGNLSRMAKAFDAIAEGTAQYVLTDGNREYAFGEFSIIVNADKRP